MQGRGFENRLELPILATPHAIRSFIAMFPYSLKRRFACASVTCLLILSGCSSDNTSTATGPSASDAAGAAQSGGTSAEAVTAGSATTSTGGTLATGGTNAVPAGEPAANAGTPAANAGTPAPSAGTPAANAGTPAPSAGTPAPSAGTPAPSAGTPAPSAGTPAPSGGTPGSGGAVAGGEDASGGANGNDPAACDPNTDFGNLAPNEKIVVGYYPNWAVYGRHYYLHNYADTEDPGVASCTVPHPYYTHIQFAFVNVSPDGRCVSSDPSVDLPRSDCDCSNPNPPHFRNNCDCGWVKTFGGNEGLFRDMAALKQANPNVKMIMSIGGWTYSQNFSDVARTPEARSKFVNSCVDFMNRYGFDGIDIDWEYPGGGGRDANTCAEGADPCTQQQKVAPENWVAAGDGATYSQMQDRVCRSCRAEDGENYVALLKDFRNAMPQGRTLSVAVGGSPARIADMNVRDMACYLDWMGIMTYDFHGAWEQQTGFHSPLRRSPDRNEPDGLSIVESVDNFVAAGLPRLKAVTGTAFYGRGWVNAQQAAPGGPAQGPQGNHNAQTGDVTDGNGTVVGRWEAGIWDFRGISEQYLRADDQTQAAKAGYVRGWDEAAQSPYLYSQNDGVWFAYDDAQSLRVKGQYVRDNNLRGTIVWDVTSDDCKNTLAQAINEGLGRNVAPPLPCRCR